MKIEVLGRYETNGFLLSYLIFLLRIDVGITIKHCRADAVCQQAFNDGGGTGSTAGMEQNSVFAVGSLNFQHSHEVF